MITELRVALRRWLAARDVSPTRAIPLRLATHELAALVDIFVDFEAAISQRYPDASPGVAVAQSKLVFARNVESLAGPDRAREILHALSWTDAWGRFDDRPRGVDRPS